MIASEADISLATERMPEPSLSEDRDKPRAEEAGGRGVPADRQHRDTVSDWWVPAVVAVV